MSIEQVMTNMKSWPNLKTMQVLERAVTHQYMNSVEFSHKLRLGVMSSMVLSPHIDEI